MARRLQTGSPVAVLQMSSPVPSVASEAHSVLPSRPHRSSARSHVTNMTRPAERVVAFYNKRGTCEQWIKEGKGAIKWTRLSCCSFAANAVRLQLHALAYNLANFMRTLALPEAIKQWSLTSLREKLVKIGAKVVHHGRYVIFQMAEVAVPKELFQEILRLIADYSHSHHQRLRLRKTPDGPVFNSYRWEECVQIPAKMVRSAPRPMFGLPELTVAARTALLSCWKAVNAHTHPSSGAIWGIPAQSSAMNCSTVKSFTRCKRPR